MIVSAAWTKGKRKLWQRVRRITTDRRVLGSLLPRLTSWRKSVEILFTCKTKASTITFERYERSILDRQIQRKFQGRTFSFSFHNTRMHSSCICIQFIPRAWPFACWILYSSSSNQKGFTSIIRSKLQQWESKTTIPLIVPSEKNSGSSLATKHARKRCSEGNFNETK